GARSIRHPVHLLCQRGHLNRKVAGSQVLAEVFAVLIAGEPHLHTVETVNLRVAPIDVPLGTLGTAGARTDRRRGCCTRQAQGHCWPRWSSAAAGRERCSGRATGEGRESVTLASTTAMYGSTTAPITGMMIQ